MVGLNEIDFTRKLKPSALFNYFQEVANLAAEALGVGMNRVEREFGVAWILVRVRVELLRQLDWNEQLIIETWPQEPGKVEFQRDYLVLDQTGGIVARAVTGWVIMDTKQRRLRRTNLIPLQLPAIDRPRALDCQLRRLPEPGDLAPVYQRVIGYSDIDVYGHLNNSKYVDFIMDCFPVEFHRRHRMQSLELSFVNEALPGDTIQLLMERQPHTTGARYVEGINQRSGQKVFRAQVGFGCSAS